MLSLPNRIRCLHMKSVSRQFLATCATTVVDKALFLRIVNVLHCLKVHSISTVLTYECSHKLDIDTEETFEMMWKLTADFYGSSELSYAFIVSLCLHTHLYRQWFALLGQSRTKMSAKKNYQIVQSYFSLFILRGCIKVVAYVAL